MQAHKTGAENISGGEEKIALLKWIATQGKFLSKITVQIDWFPSLESGKKVVDFTPATALALDHGCWYRRQILS